jgi:hypothetical protein
MYPLRRASDPPGTTVDFDAERAGCLAIVAASVLFLVSAYYSWHELRYLFQGETVVARVARTYETIDVGRRGRRIKRRAVEYAFADSASGEERKERDLVALNWQVSGETILVQYIPGGKGQSRLSGHRNTFSVVIFISSLILIAVFVYRMHREVNSPPVRRRPGRRRPTEKA